MPNPPCPLRARLSDDYNIKRPETFLIFIGDKQFNLLARNTNMYTVYQLENHSKAQEEDRVETN
jgi:hypothetical protein